MGNTWHGYGKNTRYLWVYPCHYLTTMGSMHAELHTSTPPLLNSTPARLRRYWVSTPTALASHINCNDKYSNEAGVHKLMHTELLAPSPPMNNADAFETATNNSNSSHMRLLGYFTFVVVSSLKLLGG